MTLLVSGLAVTQLFGEVSAQELDAAQEQAAETADTVEPDTLLRQTNLDPEQATPSPHAAYESMTQEEWDAYVAQVQARQETQQLRMYVLYSSDAELLNEDEGESAVTALSLSLDEVTQHEARQSRSVDVQEPVWHNPLVLKTYVTSPFGMRLHPVYGYYRMHYGVDLNGYYGDEIRATRAGTVVEEGWDEYYGYYVVIDHGDGFQSEYFHMTRYFVEEGQVVEACELIGLVGSTGTSTGAHLHFGLIYQGEYVDPQDYVDFQS